MSASSTENAKHDNRVKAVEWGIGMLRADFPEAQGSFWGRTPLGVLEPTTARTRTDKERERRGARLYDSSGVIYGATPERLRPRYYEAEGFAVFRLPGGTSKGRAGMKDYRRPTRYELRQLEGGRGTLVHVSVEPGHRWRSALRWLEWIGRQLAGARCRECFEAEDEKPDPPNPRLEMRADELRGSLEEG